MSVASSIDFLRLTKLLEHWCSRAKVTRRKSVLECHGRGEVLQVQVKKNK